jgi:hypothetical protein
MQFNVLQCGWPLGPLQHVHVVQVASNKQGEGLITYFIIESSTIITSAQVMSYHQVQRPPNKC